jgi:AraC-like DNA-binding protein/catechol 2,3-dioxygenase-like lactoylglutathione lyase family enzyme
MLRVRDTIDRSYGADLDVEALARLANLSPDHLIRTFRSVFGETPHRYLQRRRVERAMNLLRSTDLDVTEVCLAVGFTSLGTFSRLFSAVVGTPPAGRCPRRPAASRWPGPGPARSSRHRPAPRPHPGRIRRFRRSPTRSAPASVGVMKLSHPRLSSIYVLDQDQALDFYVGVLGLEVATDADLGFMRWLTVRVPGDDREILLERPGPPAHDPQTAEQVRELVAKGAGGGWIGFQADDVDAVHAELVERGVEITQPPTDQSYGRDIGLRDPFGNNLRIGNITG